MEGGGGEGGKGGKGEGGWIAMFFRGRGNRQKTCAVQEKVKMTPRVGRTRCDSGSLGTHSAVSRSIFLLQHLFYTLLTLQIKTWQWAPRLLGASDCEDAGVARRVTDLSSARKMSWVLQNLCNS